MIQDFTIESGDVSLLLTWCYVVREGATRMSGVLTIRSWGSPQ